MALTISHPTDRPNFTRADLGDITIWFSYETPIAFRAPGLRGTVVRENDWSTTTGKHLNYINEDKSARVDTDTFLGLARAHNVPI